MKIAMVFDGIGFGGITSVGIAYIRILLKLGYHVDIYNLSKSTEKEVDIPTECNIYRKSLNSCLCPEKYCGGVKRYWWGRFAYPVIYLILSLYICFKRIFEHNKEKYDIVIAFSGHWNDLTYVVKNFINAKYKIGWLHGALYQYLLTNDGYLNLYRDLKNLVVIVDKVQEETLIYNSFVKLNIFKIPNPTFILERKINYDKVNKLKEKYGDFWIMAALLMQPKDHLTLFKALNLLREKYEYKPKLLLLGDGPNRKYIEDLIEKFNLQEQVVLCGNVNDIENYYTACYALVHSSKLEGFGMVVLEALLFSKPVVVTNCGFGIEEILSGIKSKLICEVGDYECMAKYMFKLSNDKKFYNEFKRETFLYMNKFMPENIEKKLVHFFNNLRM